MAIFAARSLLIPFSRSSWYRSSGLAGSLAILDPVGLRGRSELPACRPRASAPRGCCSSAAKSLNVLTIRSSASGAWSSPSSRWGVSASFRRGGQARMTLAPESSLGVKRDNMLGSHRRLVCRRNGVRNHVRLPALPPARCRSCRDRAPGPGRGSSARPRTGAQPRLYPALRRCDCGELALRALALLPQRDRPRRAAALLTRARLLLESSDSAPACEARRLRAGEKRAFGGSRQHRLPQSSTALSHQ